MQRFSSTLHFLTELCRSSSVYSVSSCDSSFLVVICDDAGHMVPYLRKQNPLYFSVIDQTSKLHFVEVLQQGVSLCFIYRSRWCLRIIISIASNHGHVSFKVTLDCHVIDLTDSTDCLPLKSGYYFACSYRSCLVVYPCCYNCIQFASVSEVSVPILL